MVARAYVPDAGDLVWLTFDPQAGHEQRGSRPVALPAGGTIGGVVLADHVKSVDWRARRAAVAGRAPDAVVDDVRERLRPLLGM